MLWKQNITQIVNFFNASLGSHLPFTWRSIWCLRGLFEPSIGWRVRNGKSINIWNKDWPPGPRHVKITWQNININFTIVANLINYEQITWRLEVLRKLFDEEQANIIHTIPIAGVDIKDIGVWKGDNTGVYSAKRWYKWLFKERTTQMQKEVTLQPMIL